MPYGARVNERLVWIDCEMTGLDLRADALVEVAALVTDFDLNVLGDGVDIIIKPPPEALEQMIDFVRTMHVTSGLLEELEHGVTLAEAEAEVMAYVREHCTPDSRPPLAGNTVATDRAFLARDMSELDAFLHYRIVDVSSIKELSRRWYPRAYFGAPTKRGNHRALADIQESIEELRYYRDAVFVPPPGPDSATAKQIAERHGGALTGLGPSPAVNRFSARGLNPLHFLRSRSLHGARVHGGYSSAGRAPPCGGGCRGFESRYSPQPNRPRTSSGGGSHPYVRGDHRWRARRPGLSAQAEVRGLHPARGRPAVLVGRDLHPHGVPAGGRCWGGRPSRPSCPSASGRRTRR